ncbi:VOC family protein [Pontibacillus salicampi]|uniref:VOC family protein n=1 Tax=Pontibacillus salicampi TaxID=1449801 RepID=A0ABV6LIH6_9BACI
MSRGMIHHVEVNVSDLPKSLSFWDWLLTHLGYEPYQEWEQGKSYRLGSSYLVFVQTEEEFLTPSYHRKRTGLNHLAFYGDSQEHVDELTRLLREKRIPILYEKEHPYAGGEHYYAVFFEDPDRIKVEVVSP